jgi:hypothetical protein
MYHVSKLNIKYYINKKMQSTVPEPESPVFKKNPRTRFTEKILK